MLKRARARIYRFLAASFEGNIDSIYLKYLMRSAALGEGWSQNNLAVNYFNGHLVPKNPQRALELYLEAASCGQLEAFLNLGRLYKDGVHVALDYCQAAYWFSRAVTEGDGRGEYQLGLIYYNGMGVEKNYGTALNLLKNAQRKGIYGAELIIKELESYGHVSG